MATILCRGGRATNIKMRPRNTFSHKFANKETARDAATGATGTVQQIGHIALNRFLALRQAGQLPIIFPGKFAGLFNLLNSSIIVRDYAARFLAQGDNHCARQSSDIDNLLRAQLAGVIHCIGQHHASLRIG